MIEAGGDDELSQLFMTGWKAENLRLEDGAIAG
jgi:hypothetical protein